MIIYLQVNSALKEHNREDLVLSSAEQSEISLLIDFLSVFKEETEKLEAENSPTLQYYLLSYYRLRKHCLPNDLDHDGMRNLRQRAYNLLEQKFVPDKLHKIATFLWPQFRNLKMLSANEKEEVCYFLYCVIYMHHGFQGLIFVIYSIRCLMK